MRGRKNSRINYQKIPFLPSVASWKEVAIQESGEKLVSLNKENEDRILVEPQYLLQGIKDSINEYLVRETVANMLIEAAKLLPNSYKFVIWDAWRPIETQKAIFNSYKEKLRNLNPDLSEKELITADDFSDKATTRYFEEKIERGEGLSDNERIILNNRRLLFHTLTATGFTNYPDE